MKRFLFSLGFLFLLLVQIFAQQGHFHVDLADRSIAFEQIEAALPKLLNSSKQTTFVKERDYVDRLGFRRQTYKQFWGKVEIENALVMIHGRDGQVDYLNGNIMQEAQQPSPKAFVRTRSSFNIPANAEYMLTSIEKDGEKIYVPAYKYTDMKKKKEVYIDAQTGAVLKEISLLRNFSSPISETQTKGKLPTLYSGMKEVDVVDSAGVFYIEDRERKIYTKDAGGVLLDTTGIDLDTISDATLADMLLDMFDNKYRSYKSQTQTFDSVYSVTQLTITGMDEIFLDDEDRAFVSIDIRRKDGTPVERLCGGILKLPIEAYLDYNHLPDDSCQIMLGAFCENEKGEIGVKQIVLASIASKESKDYSWDTPLVKGHLSVGKTAEMGYDAHWAMVKTYDYYVDKFDRKSYDGEGSPIRQMVNVSNLDPMFGVAMPLNAFAYPLKDRESYMVYGKGDGLEMSPLVALNIIAHEYTHLITEHNGNGGLVYKGESGALNESFSDMFGASVNFNVNGEKASWLIGDGVILCEPYYLRSMSDPKTVENPDTYKGEFWTPTDSLEYDNGGVHRNSGVPNHWFYLLSDGGTGTNDNGDDYTVEGVGLEKAEQIAYHTLVTYLQPEATMADARKGALRAAQDLYKKDSKEYIAVAKAWYAVGVGEDYKPVAIEEVLSNKSVNLYPTVATDVVYINGEAEIAAINIISLNGVHTPTLANPSDRVIDVSHLAAGVHFFVVTYKDGTRSTHRIIKQTN